MHFKPHTELRAGHLSQAVLWHWGRNVGEESGRKKERKRDQINVEKPSYQREREGDPSPPRLRIRGRAGRSKASGYANMRAGGTMQMTHKMS